MALFFGFLGENFWGIFFLENFGGKFLGKIVFWFGKMANPTTCGRKGVVGYGGVCGVVVRGMGVANFTFDGFDGDLTAI